MLGTVLNVSTVVVGAALGSLLGARLSEKTQHTVMSGLGLVTLVVGMQMALQTRNILLVLGGILLGGLLGEGFRLQDGLERLGAILQNLFRSRSGSSLSEGFVTASLVFCVGPMAVLGSIQDGLGGDFRLLAVKSTLDGFAAVAFAATLGWGVLLSAASVLVFQGSITFMASALDRLLSAEMITEMSATGGLLIMAIGLKLLNIKDVRVANFLPALAVAPAIVFLMPWIRSWWPF
ncbi:DUF554 domain-containing protein [Desulfosoma caldarium]|uniref:Membrane protein YdfK n=1 Tax=Desulfosoma caldarium TaxID=610254 RepID=A0A3N1VJL4_9BACT|nr:DUF554 domain-containing protein [Desulfosoma caldarium]ROR02995.1 hypothetical protein EDC27_0250 [Desulfosoma caldarium]